MKATLQERQEQMRQRSASSGTRRVSSGTRRVSFSKLPLEVQRETHLANARAQQDYENLLAQENDPCYQYYDVPTREEALYALCREHVPFDGAKHAGLRRKFPGISGETRCQIILLRRRFELELEKRGLNGKNNH